MPTMRFEFMSREWIEMARSEIQRALAGKHLGSTTFTLCEAFTAAPEHLRQGDSDTVGFCVRVGPEGVEVGDLQTEGADCTIVSDYADAREIAKDASASAADPKVMAERVADGRLRIVGDPSAAPPALQEVNLHELLAAHTK